VLEKLRREGFVRVRVDGEVLELGGPTPVRLEKGKTHRIEAVVDRLVVRDGIRQRLADSVDTALRWGEGRLLVMKQAVGALDWTPQNFSTHFADPETGFTLPPLTPKHFSFNSHYGACPACEGLGTEQYIDPDLLVPSPELSLADGAIAPWAKAGKSMQGYYVGILESLCRAYRQKMDTPWQDLSPTFQQAVLHGTGPKEVDLTWGEGSKRETVKKSFEGVVAQMEHLYATTESELSRQRIRAYMGRQTCTECRGARLRSEILAVTLKSAENEKGIHEFCRQTVSDARWFIQHLVLGGEQKVIAAEVVREIGARLSFMEEVGLGYLSLDRESGTLSGGEAQRIRLATQIGSGLAGCLYVLDEPSIGLHQRDNDRLIGTLRRLRDLGNSVIVVEHDEDTIRAADHVLDLGPGAGLRGGQLIAQGTPDQVAAVEASLTGQYLAGTARIPVPKNRVKPRSPRPTPSSLGRNGAPGWLSVIEAEENNLQHITASFPLGCLTCVTGVSGSGKSTLIDDILRRALFRHFYRSKDKPGRHRSIVGLDQLDKSIVIDQTPIGRTPRSNPVTYTGAFGAIRELFAGLPASRIRGYDTGRFSFNVKGGRCEACEGDGVKKIEMHFLADVYVECEVCRGRRYNRETLEITYKGKNIADILDMTVDEASRFFRNIPGISDKLLALEDVGLGYLHLGQSGTTLSGGEAQRIKLAAELAKKATGRTVYILDEPTTGLHFADIHKLLEVLLKLRDSGNTLIIIEHNLEVIKCADWVLDMGPEGGNGGGRIVAEGTPEDVAKVETSHTGRYLKRLLK
jgi:excinuclease ABC subunit A